MFKHQHQNTFDFCFAHQHNTNMISNNVKRCRVCGDFALCFNFNGLSCEACKVFFRRGVLRKNEYECTNNFQCVVSLSTRKGCKRCRMDKCYLIGMKKENILGVVLEEKALDTRMPQIISDSTELQPYDLLRIGEIQQAMTNFPDESKSKLLGISKDPVYISNLAQYYVRNAIKYCKQLEAFKQMRSTDQLNILKNFYPEMSLVYMSYIYERAKDGMRLITNNSGDKAIFFKVDVSPDYRPAEDLPGQFRRFVHPMSVALGNDDIIRNLIIAQLLFKPRGDTNLPEFVKYNYTIYCRLLRKYLLYKYRHNADRKFNLLMAVMKDVGSACTLFRHLYSNEIALEEINPIIVELYDLKGNNATLI